MNYSDSREHLGGYDTLLRFYGCWREQGSGALTLQLVHAGTHCDCLGNCSAALSQERWTWTNIMFYVN